MQGEALVPKYVRFPMASSTAPRRKGFTDRFVAMDINGPTAPRPVYERAPAANLAVNEFPEPTTTTDSRGMALLPVWPRIANHGPQPATSPG